MDRIQQAINKLLAESEGEISSRIEEIFFDLKVKDTQTKCYCHCLKSDANGNLRLRDLVEFLDQKIVDYAIPRKEIDEAKAVARFAGQVFVIYK